MIDPAIFAKYPKQKIDQAIAYLSYRDIKELPKDENPNFPILYVFRHGQTEDNANFLFSGWRDSDLTELGVKQAGVLADKLAHKKIGLLYSSDQIRAIKTIEIAVSKNESAKSLKIFQDPRIKERSYGDLQGTSKLVMQLENPTKLLEYRRSYFVQPPNGESIAQVVLRVKDFIEDLFLIMRAKKYNVAVSCHGNSIRGFRQYFEGLSNEETASLETPLGQDYLAYSVHDEKRI